MAEVTVDARPKAHAPYDPAVIPESVKRRAARVDALYSSTSQPALQVAPIPAQNAPIYTATEQPAPAAPEPEQLPLPMEAPASPVQEPPAQAQPPAAAADDENSQTWHHRYLAMQGRYNASQKTIGEMQEQMVQLGNELLHTQQMVTRGGARPVNQQPVLQNYLTEKDVQEYGTDLVDFAQRAAAQAVAPRLQALDDQNQELQRRLAQEARARLDMRVEASVPNFREIDQDPRWHRWLVGIDVLSGRVRQQLLNEAIAAAEAPRVISFFRGFLQEEQATGHIEPAQYSQPAAPLREAAIPLASLAAPGRARPANGGDPSIPPERPIYTRAQIAQLYRMNQKGAFVGREAEWARQEADFIAAGREGRVH